MTGPLPNELARVQHAGAAVRAVNQTHAESARVARDARRAAVLDALGEGLTLREIAAALGVSYQRVHQIAQSGRSEA